MIADPLANHLLLFSGRTTGFKACDIARKQLRGTFMQMIGLLFVIFIRIVWQRLGRVKLHFVVDL